MNDAKIIAEPQSNFLEKYDIRCEICGKRSVTFDSWFNYQPCEDHRHLTPRQYGDMKEIIQKSEKHDEKTTMGSLSRRKSIRRRKRKN